MRKVAGQKKMRKQGAINCLLVLVMGSSRVWAAMGSLLAMELLEKVVMFFHVRRMMGYMRDGGSRDVLLRLYSLSYCRTIRVTGGKKLIGIIRRGMWGMSGSGGALVRVIVAGRIRLSLVLM